MSNRNNIGSLKTLNINPYINEQNISISVPSAISTGSPQVSFTFSQLTMSPSFTGNVTPISYRNIFGTNVGLQNTSGTTQTVYWQINKNGSSYKTGNTSVTNNYYYTISLMDWANNGDKYDFYVWCSTALTLNYQNYFTIPSRIDTGAKTIKDMTFQLNMLATSTYFPLTGKIGNGNAGQIQIWSGWNTTNINSAINGGMGVNNVTYYFPVYQLHQTYKLFTTNNGDGGSNASSNVSANGAIANASTYNIYNNFFPSTITYHEIFFR